MRLLGKGMYRRRRWLFFFLMFTISISVYGLIQKPDLLLPTFASTDGELNELLEILGYALSRIGIISLILILLLYIRESLRATERKEEHYEDKALRIRTGVAGESINVNDEVRKVIRDVVLSSSMEGADDANDKITGS